MALLGGFFTPTTFPPVGVVREFMYGVSVDPAGPFGSGCRVPMSRPAGGLLDEFGVAWQAQGAAFDALVAVLLDGVAVKTLHITGNSGFSVGGPPVPWPFNTHVSFGILVAAGGGGAPLQASVVVRPGPGLATHGRIQASLAFASVYLPSEGTLVSQDTEFDAAGWTGVGYTPLGTGILIPKAGCSVFNVYGDIPAGTNTLSVLYSLQVSDALGTDIGGPTFAPGEDGLKSAIGPFPLGAAGKVLLAHGKCGPVVGPGGNAIVGPVRLVGSIAIPA